MYKNKYLYAGITLLVAAGMAFYNLPGDWQKQILPILPDSIANNKINLGLDLQGGSQLDYKIDLRNVPDEDKQDIINGVINVITKRVNGLGVSEPNIYSSAVGNENHIIVELAGIKDLEEAKATVGKTIQLEFKERKDTVDPDYAKKVKEQAEQALQKVKTTDFKTFGEEESRANSGKVSYQEQSEFKFADEVSEQFGKILPQMKVGEVYGSLIEPTAGEYTISADGQLVENKGYYLLKLTDQQTVDRNLDQPRKVKFARILIKGSEETNADQAAKQKAEAILTAINQVRATPGLTNDKINVEGLTINTAGPVSFATLAKEFSEDSSSKEQDGVMEQPAVTGSDAEYSREIRDAVLAFQAAGEINSSVVKNSEGYNILKAVEIIPEKKETRQEAQYKFATIFFSALDDSWQETDLNGQYFQRADISFDSLYNPIVQISFNAEGAKKFEQLTEKNLNKPIAIFVGGNLISAPNVNEKISGGQAVISGRFTLEQAETLARDLNTGAIPAPITLVGQYTIGASLGQDALEKSIQAGLIGFLLVGIFMFIYYRWAGLIATLALGIYAIILVFLIKVNVPLYVSLPISVAVFVYLIIAILNNKDSGPEKFIALLLASFVLFFLSFILSTSVVMTLAGIAGVILSIGMAVDANILIFERIKEELRDGRPVESAVRIGFDRAWSSIKDSNFSSLITCAILFYFGSSMIQGFAFNLAAGILVSMFTAITISRLFLYSAEGLGWLNNAKFFGFPKKLNPLLWPIIAKRGILYTISAVILIVSISGAFIFGLKPGMDFTGGSLLEIKFSKAVSNEEVKGALVEIQKELKGEVTTPTNETAASPESELTSPTASLAELDLTSANVISTGESIIIKTKYITTEQQESVTEKMKAKFGDLEVTRFQTIGATVGQSVTTNAIMAVVIASIAIISYIAFAFRQVPKSIGKWKFGVSAVIALLHDLIVMLGIYTYLGGILGVEIDALFITALLTVMGFSVHDTIVVLDRLREKLKNPGKDETFADLTNQAVNETIERSINTSISTMLALLALVIFGHENIRFFNLALLIGIFVGTYSSIFIASPLLVDWVHRSASKK